MKINVLKKYLDFAYLAYEGNTSQQKYRQKGNIPFIFHPLWCASVLINDTKIALKEREIGAKALILHDILENTDLDLPNWVEKDVKEAVEKLTFDKDENTIKEIITMSSFVKLLFLTDLLASMYENHVSKPKRKIWKLLVKLLLNDVKKHYGNIRIVQIGNTVYKNTNW
ncbi:MAG: hypothetical protein ACFFG0_35215 [Candidatus Thorarchaeota archaeon]